MCWHFRETVLDAGRLKDGNVFLMLTIFACFDCSFFLLFFYYYCCSFWSLFFFFPVLSHCFLLQVCCLRAASSLCEARRTASSQKSAPRVIEICLIR
jgi:hypothetical protein